MTAATITGTILSPTGQPKHATLFARLTAPTVDSAGAVVAGLASVSSSSRGVLTASLTPGAYRLTLAMSGCESMTVDVTIEDGGFYGIGSLFGLAPKAPAPDADGRTVEVAADSADGLTYTIPDTAVVSDDGLTYTTEA